MPVVPRARSSISRQRSYAQIAEKIRTRLRVGTTEFGKFHVTIQIDSFTETGRKRPTIGKKTSATEGGRNISMLFLTDTNITQRKSRRLHSMPRIKIRNKQRRKRKVIYSCSRKIGNIDPCTRIANLLIDRQ